LQEALLKASGGLNMAYRYFALKDDLADEVKPAEPAGKDGKKGKEKEGENIEIEERAETPAEETPAAGNPLRDPGEALAANSWRLRTLNILDRTMSYNEVWPQAGSR
jgi:hypothetical protein